MKPGDIIVAYRKGIHIVTRIDPLAYNSTGTGGKIDKIYYRPLYNSDYKKSGDKNEYECSANWCTLLSDIMIDKMELKIKEKLERLHQIRKTHSIGAIMSEK